MKRDIRLYAYYFGALRKTGSGKTGIHKHQFDNVDECKARIEVLRRTKTWENDQFLIIEYFPREHSSDNSSVILEIVNPLIINLLVTH